MPEPSAAQKYGVAHRALRKRWAREVEAGGVRCWRCDGPIAPDGPWDLGHTDDGSRHAGPEHRECNRRAGGKVRAAQLYGTAAEPRPRRPPFPRLSDPDPGNAVTRWSRHWYGDEFNPRCPDCRESGEACEVALARAVA